MVLFKGMIDNLEIVKVHVPSKVILPRTCESKVGDSK